MLPVALIVGFIAFIYYRVMTVLMFHAPMTVLACLLSAILTGLILAIATNFYMLRVIGRAVDTENETAKLPLHGPMFPILLAALLANVAQGYIITLGFSERLYREVSRTAWRRSVFEQDYFWFIVMLCIPVLVHYFVSVAMARRAFKNNSME